MGVRIVSFWFWYVNFYIGSVWNISKYFVWRNCYGFKGWWCKSDFWKIGDYKFIVCIKKDC